MAVRVVCPSCKAAYEVPEAAFVSGPKRLRCARCKEEWLAEPAAPVPVLRPPTAAPDLPGPLERIADVGVGVGARSGPAPATQAQAISTAGPSTATATATAVLEGPSGPADALVAPPDRRAARGDSAAPPAGRRGTGSRVGAATAVVVLAWVLSCVVLAACGAAAVIWRTDVMRAWPPSERAYVALGLR